MVMKRHLDTASSFLLSISLCIGMQTASAQIESMSEPSEEDIQIPLEGDSRPQSYTPSSAEEAVGHDLDSLTEASDYVFDGVLMDANVHTPDNSKIIATGYQFHVNQWLKGYKEGDEISLTAAGGEYADGSGMDISGALKLIPGRRYLVWVRSGGETMLRPFHQVLQVYAEGQRVADQHGRVVTQLQNSQLVTRGEAEVNHLFYLHNPVEDGGAIEMGPPESSDSPPAEQAPVIQESGNQPLVAEAIFDYLRNTTNTAIINQSGNILFGTEPGKTPRYYYCGFVRSSQNYFYWMPSDDNWAWTDASGGNWNTLVNPGGGCGDWLIGFWNDASGNPIRNRVPVAGNSVFNAGVPSDALMISGGYGGDWASFSANGLTFFWYTGADCSSIQEIDVFVNPAISGDEEQFRKSLTHEFGHALSLNHEDRLFALLYPGTWRQPPNYASTWYGRADDMRGVRASLTGTNATFPNTWVFEQWSDMATWSQTHENTSTPGNLIMTALSTYNATQGQTISLHHMQVENRGNLSANNVVLKVYLSTNNIISSADFEVYSGSWTTFAASTSTVASHWSNGTLNFTIPTSVPPGNYFVGWILTSSDASERSTANNTAILVRDATSNFSARTLSVSAASGGYQLSISKAGTGKGTVTSNPAGINCGLDCSQTYASGTAVALSATPAAGSSFAGWSGDKGCSSAVTMMQDMNCTATFSAKVMTYMLNIAKAGSGFGTVTSKPTGINCGLDCEQAYVSGTSVVLTATPREGSKFIGWSGDKGCASTVSMTINLSCIATFNPIAASHTLTVTKSGSGTVTSSPAGIDCGGDCSQSYNFGTKVILSATGTSGQSFSSWSGDSDCSDGILNMYANRNCTANFLLPDPGCSGVSPVVSGNFTSGTTLCEGSTSVTTASTGVTISNIGTRVQFLGPIIELKKLFKVVLGAEFWASYPVTGCIDPTDTDGDRLKDCVETNTGIFVDANNTGTDPNNPDTDGDAIKDGDEALGTLAGLDLPALGASPVHKDILLEYDWIEDSLECGAHTHKPNIGAINKVKAAFAGATLSNPDGTTGVNVIQDYGQGGVFDGGNLFTDADGDIAGGVNSTEFNAHKAANFNSNRHGYFHYVLFPHTYNNGKSSGQAELPGDDLIVSLYCAHTDQNVANTIVHELGHNLILGHGGFENRNWKPNYNSVMNYKYQFNGIDICSDADPNGNGILNYSIGDRIDLNENNLNENHGTCGSGVSPAWDWNGSGTIESSVVKDINCDSGEVCDGSLDNLQDNDDWKQIVFTGLSDADGAVAPRDVEIISCDNPAPMPAK